MIVPRTGGVFQIHVVADPFMREQFESGRIRNPPAAVTSNRRPRIGAANHLRPQKYMRLIHLLGVEKGAEELPAPFHEHVRHLPPAQFFQNSLHGRRATG